MLRLSPALLVVLALPAALALGCAPEEPAASASEEDLLEAKPLFAEPEGDKTRYPIVLAHGFDASPTNRWGFYGVAEALRADGHEIVVAIVPPYNAPEIRGAYLAEQIDRALADLGAEKVNVVAHSMGGLDARHVVSSLGYADRVASVTTISSPHHGTAVADLALGLLPGEDEDELDEVLDALAEAWGLRFSDLAEDTDVRAALSALAEANIDAFNEKNPDAPGVYYQSWAGVSNVMGVPNPKDDDACEGKLLRHKLRADRMDATLVPMAAVVAHGKKLDPNDGMATVESAKWGEFRGCVPADHLDEVGQPKDKGMNGHTGFDHLRFHRTIAFDLSELGF